MALVTSLLLLVIITILALSMFRSFGTQEKIAGNLREKERALHAAVSAQQYAEWWLLQGNNTAAGAIACTVSRWLRPRPWARSATRRPSSCRRGAVTQVPWPIQVTYTPQNMMSRRPGDRPGQSALLCNPAFWITDRGMSADGCR